MHAKGERGVARAIKIKFMRSHQQTAVDSSDCPGAVIVGGDFALDGEVFEWGFPVGVCKRVPGR